MLLRARPPRLSSLLPLLRCSPSLDSSCFSSSRSSFSSRVVAAAVAAAAAGDSLSSLPL